MTTPDQTPARSFRSPVATAVTPTPAPLDAGTFVPDATLAKLGEMTRQDADACDFGIIQLDDAGVVRLYNRYQERLANITADSCEGKNFFTHVAPCANNGLFFGLFKRGVASGDLNVLFPYTFTFKLKLTSVRVHLFRCKVSRTNWCFVRRA